MKLLYIALCDLCANGEAGIRNKVWAQLKCLSKKFDTYLISWENFLICSYKGEKRIGKKVLLCYADIYEYLADFVKDKHIEVIFIRYLQTNPWMNGFLQKMKKSGRKVIIEFPTIPYEEELRGRVELEEDTIYRNKLHKYVKYSTNYNGLESVFGIPSVSIHNGVNPEDIPMKKEHLSDELVLIAVAGMNYWHGYDRLIKGMADYYRDMENQGGVYEKVIFRLVGLGKEIPRYQDLIIKNKLEPYVRIEGVKLGQELNELFDEADIAVGPLATFRSQVNITNSAIKTKEYCIRGIPMIMGENDLGFQEELNFVIKVSNDESNICIRDVITFYHNYKTYGNSKMIRNYAEERFTWDKQFEKVYDMIGI